MVKRTIYLPGMWWNVMWREFILRDLNNGK